MYKLEILRKVSKQTKQPEGNSLNHIFLTALYNCPWHVIVFAAPIGLFVYLQADV